VPSRWTWQRDGLDVVEALDLCITTHGCLPTRTELEAFARANRFAMNTRGEPTPASAPPKAERPNYPQAFEHIVNDTKLPHAVKKRWSKPRCLEWLIEFLLWLPPALPPTSDTYKGFSEARPGAPWLRSFERYGGFTALRTEATSVLMV